MAASQLCDATPWGPHVSLLQTVYSHFLRLLCSWQCFKSPWHPVTLHWAKADQVGTERNSFGSQMAVGHLLKVSKPVVPCVHPLTWPNFVGSQVLYWEMHQWWTKVGSLLSIPPQAATALIKPGWLINAKPGQEQQRCHMISWSRLSRIKPVSEFEAASSVFIYHCSDHTFCCPVESWLNADSSLHMIDNVLFTLFFFFKDVIYLFMRQRERERQRHRQREKKAPCREPDAGLDPRIWDHSPNQRQMLNHWATQVPLGPCILFFF